MRKLSIWDIIISVVTLGVVCASLVPAVARMQRTPEDAKCQSNMRRLAEAMQIYTADNDKRYPTNRTKQGMALTAQAFLSPKQYDENGNPVRFVNSINWVEALYPYLIDEAKKTGRDWESFLKCPKASNARYPTSSTTARVSYVFNYNLLENYPGLVRNSAKLMMMREFDRLVESVCRPMNNTTGISTAAPQSPFLTKSDTLMRGVPTNSKMHGQGSHILFADGHVMYFEDYYFPNSPTLAPTDSWDPETGQWWNFADKSPALDKAIAVTP